MKNSDRSRPTPRIDADFEVPCELAVPSDLEVPPCDLEVPPSDVEVPPLDRQQSSKVPQLHNANDLRVGW